METRFIPSILFVTTMLNVLSKAIISQCVAFPKFAWCLWGDLQPYYEQCVLISLLSTRWGCKSKQYWLKSKLIFVSLAWRVFLISSILVCRFVQDILNKLAKWYESYFPIWDALFSFEHSFVVLYVFFLLQLPVKQLPKSWRKLTSSSIHMQTMPLIWFSKYTQSASSIIIVVLDATFCPFS